ncbi:substrate-binding domain-containing protein [Pendulispora albinea]|uniref:Substrate-binding domain-containing protein n=1 Tax=Pendulispora albinea TaxID=2741071 RepID=A0ABZ2LN73_9BACT
MRQRQKLGTKFVRLTAAMALLPLGVFAALGASACDKGGSNGGASGGSNASEKEGTAAAAATKKTTIAVIPKGTTHEFWKSVHAGAVKASKEEKVDIVWKGPLKEDDLKGQIDVVESFTSQKVSGITVAPLSDKALVNSVTQATAAKVPVLVFDSDLASDQQISFVATDNLAAGKIAGENMVKLLNGKGKIIVLRYQEGSASTAKREQGFLEAVKEAKGIEVVSENRYAGATTESAFSASENLLAAQKAAAGNIQGIFTPNESSTFGMLLALRKANLAGKIKFVGFDGSDKLLAGLKDGHIDGLLLQNPFRMGYLSIKTMAKHLRGEPIEKRVDTGAAFITKANMDSPDMQEVVHPDLKTWLQE